MGTHFFSFNGAALFQVRKVIQLAGFPFGNASASMGPHFFKCGKRVGAQSHHPPAVASMGPHFFKCGKIKKESQQALVQSALQWGRTFSSAERR